MSDGGYSKIEKDFLGNERMVHYDASGTMIGASEVIREPDGSIRIPNEPINDLPHVEVIEPKPKVQNLDPAVGYGKKDGVPTSKLVSYLIAAFVGSCLLTLGVLSYFKSQQPTGSGATFTTAPVQNQQVVPDYTPQQEENRYPDDPKPRNDQPDPSEPVPNDQAMPDGGSDDNHPRIDPADTTPKTGNDSDPIDLRGGDGAVTDPGKKSDPPAGDPGVDPLRGEN